MNLLLDLGNTRLKWAFGTDPAALHTHAAAWDSARLHTTMEQLRATLPTAPGRLCIASVASANRQAMVLDQLRTHAQVTVEVVETPACACGVINGYREPRRLGVDRFLAMVAARDAGHAPCIVAGCGTALTLDALDVDGCHLGGLIAPGPALMRQSVLGATSKVTPMHDGETVDAAGNTEDALDSGCWHAAAALVERFTLRMRGRLGGAPRRILGGGDAERLAAMLSQPAHLQTDGVLRGLAVWARDMPPPS